MLEVRRYRGNVRTVLQARELSGGHTISGNRVVLVSGIVFTCESFSGNVHDDVVTIGRTAPAVAGETTLCRSGQLRQRVCHPGLPPRGIQPDEAMNVSSVAADRATGINGGSAGAEVLHRVDSP
jgi:hypothetical protein